MDPMRLDLFLKWSRVILRRTLAKVRRRITRLHFRKRSRRIGSIFLSTRAGISVPHSLLVSGGECGSKKILRSHKSGADDPTLQFEISLFVFGDFGIFSRLT